MSPQFKTALKRFVLVDLVILLVVGWVVWRAWGPMQPEPPVVQETVDARVLTYEALKATRELTLYASSQGGSERGVVLLLPGFMENHTTHRRLAEGLAAGGYAVGVPDLGYRLTGRPHSEYRANARRALAAINQALGREAGEPPALLAGFSAGGGNAVWLVAEGMRPSRLLLLDPVYPEPLALEGLPSLGDVPVLTIYAPPSSCNRQHDERELAEVALSSEATSLLLTAGTHCSLTERDPLCNLVCGAGTLDAEQAARELAVSWVLGQDEADSLRRWLEAGQVERVR